MAIDPRKRQKQLEKKAAKRKSAQAAVKASQAGGPSSRRPDLAANFPVHECLVPVGLFELGIGNVMVSRKLPDGDLELGAFLLDVHCLGVKDALYRVVSEVKYHDMVNRFEGHEEFQKIDPACARKLVEEAAGYAKQIGFDPHPDYKLARKIFGDIDPALCPDEFTFGRDGKPCFVSGPNDSPAKCNRIMATLTQRLGPDGFHYITDLDPEDWDEQEPDWDLDLDIED